MSKDVKDENVITTLVDATATRQEAHELTEHELNSVAGGWDVSAYVRALGINSTPKHCDAECKFDTVNHGRL
jgi:bacteriocin-like protein